MDSVEAIYRHRFSETDRHRRDRIWQTLCRHFFQRYVRAEDTVLDLGCGMGEFSRHIRAGRKIAVDQNPEVAALLPADVELHVADATCLDFLPEESVDVCFTSNFFEHLPSKRDLDALLLEVRRVLRTGGRLVALQPNIKYAPGEYWDFYDHHLPLSHLSCAEAFVKAGFRIEELRGRFLPFTTRSLLPQHPLLVRLYLLVRPAWWLLGRQFLIVGGKPGRSPDRRAQDGSVGPAASAPATISSRD